MKLAGMLRVKNEGRWLRRAIASIAPICESIHVLDDHSTDNTRAEFESTVSDMLNSRREQPRMFFYPSDFTGLDEARDKEWLFDRVMKDGEDPNWVLNIDGDEELEQEGQAIVRGDLADRGPSSYSLQVLYLWDRENQIRTDGSYWRFVRQSLFRTRNTNGRYLRTGRPGNFHCSSVPADLIGMQERSVARLKHYGYLHREDRLRKYEWYNQIDPNNRIEDCYRHMVIGDLGELPADSRTRHGGPLRLEPYAERVTLS